MPTFESLPCELRQEILRMAFTDTVAYDLEFSINIRKFICDNKFKSRLRGDLPEFLTLALKKKGGASWFPYGDAPAAYAPSTGTTASALREVFPDVVDDIGFVLKKCLLGFEHRVKVDGYDIDEADAIIEYGFCAMAKGELFDVWGDNL